MSTTSHLGYLARRLRRDTRRAVHALLDVTCPESCAACQHSATPELLCVGCQGGQVTDPLPHRLVGGDVPSYAPFTYTESVKRALHRFKFESHPELARRAGAAMWRCLPSELRSPHLWVPVPLSEPRLVERGYNQAALLARELAITSCSPSPRHWLTRTSLQQQSGLGRRERLVNALTAFTAHTQAHRHPPSPVVLVDDVLTTGATGLACIEALNAAGHTVMAIVTLAQA